eukprot:181150_1
MARAELKAVGGGFLSSISEHSLFSDAAIGSQERNSSLTHEQRLATNSSTALFFLDGEDRLKFINLSDLKLKKTSSSKTIKGDKHIPKGCDRLTCSLSGHFLCLWSAEKAIVLQMPKHAYETTDEKSVVCKVFEISLTGKITHVEWHPLSDSHLVILSKDRSLNVFDVMADCGSPEQTFHLRSSDKRRSPTPTYFCFGPPRGWERFSIFVAWNSGDIYALCPVVPDGCSIPSSVLDELDGQLQIDSTFANDPMAFDDCDTQKELRLKWLREIWVEQTSPGEESNVKCCPSETEFEFREAQLQGPLQVKPHLPDAPSYLGKTDSVMSLVSLPMGGGYGPSFLLRSWRSGNVDILMLSGGLVPIWSTKYSHSHQFPPLHAINRVQVASSPVVLHAPNARASSQRDVVMCACACGVVTLRIPWLRQMIYAVENRTDEPADFDFLDRSKCQMETLWRSPNESPRGLLLISDNLLGRFALILDNFLRCITIPLQRDTPELEEDSVVGQICTIDDGPSESKSQIEVPEPMYTSTMVDAAYNIRDCTTVIDSIPKPANIDDATRPDTVGYLLKVQERYSEAVAEMTYFHGRYTERIGLLQNSSKMQQRQLGDLEKELGSLESDHRSVQRSIQCCLKDQQTMSVLIRGLLQKLNQQQASLSNDESKLFQELSGIGESLDDDDTAIEELSKEAVQLTNYMACFDPISADPKMSSPDKRSINEAEELLSEHETTIDECRGIVEGIEDVLRTVGGEDDNIEEDSLETISELKIND